MARKPAPKKRLKRLVSKLAIRAVQAAKRVARKPRPAARAVAKPAVGRPKAVVKPAAPAARRSVVAKPTRVIPSHAPAAPRGLAKKAAPVTRRSVVAKPARGPSVRARRPAPAGDAKPRRPARARVGVAAPAKGSGAPAAPLILADGAPMEGVVAASEPSAARSVEEQFTIPAGYGDHRIVLMVRDPFWLFAYWETQAETERAIRGQLLPEEIPGLQTILRVHEVTEIDFPAQPPRRSFDIGLSGLARNWHIHVDAPGSSFLVDLGFLTAAGRFLLLARSNRVTTPRSSPSDITDESWFTAEKDYWKLFPASGIGPGASPGDWSRLFSRQLSSSAAGTHGAVGQLKTPQVKGFWCRVDADLILHGATEPRSRVMIQDQPVAVRKDGTFSVRLALPPGKQAVTIDVTAPNGRQTRTVTPIVSLAWQGPREGAREDAARPQSASEPAA